MTLSSPSHSHSSEKKLISQRSSEKKLISSSSPAARRAPIPGRTAPHLSLAIPAPNSPAARRSTDSKDTTPAPFSPAANLRKPISGSPAARLGAHTPTPFSPSPASNLRGSISGSPAALIPGYPAARRSSAPIPISTDSKDTTPFSPSPAALIPGYPAARRSSAPIPISADSKDTTPFSPSPAAHLRGSISASRSLSLSKSRFSVQNKSRELSMSLLPGSVSSGISSGSISYRKKSSSSGSSGGKKTPGSASSEIAGKKKVVTPRLVMEIGGRSDELRKGLFVLSILLLATIAFLLLLKPTCPKVLVGWPIGLILTLCLALEILLAIRTFRWKPKGPLRELGIFSKLFWNVASTLICCVIGSYIPEDDWKSFIIMLLFISVCIVSSNILVFTVNIGVTDCILGATSQAGFNLVLSRKGNRWTGNRWTAALVQLTISTGFGLIKYFSEELKKRFYGVDAAKADNDGNEMQRMKALNILAKPATKNNLVQSFKR